MKQSGIILTRKLLDNLTDLVKDSVETESIRQILEKHKQCKSDESSFPVIDVKELQQLSKFLDNERKNRENVPYLHEIIKDCHVHLPKYIPPPRNPELEARVQRLKLNLEEQCYKRMTANVSRQTTGSSGTPTSFSTDMKALRSQLIAVLNFVLTVGGSFMFTYKAVEYSLPVPNIPAQVLFAVITAVVVSVAEIYFLARYMITD